MGMCKCVRWEMLGGNQFFRTRPEHVELEKTPQRKGQKSAVVRFAGILQVQGYVLLDGGGGLLMKLRRKG